MQFTAPISGTNVVAEGEGPSRDTADRPSTLAQRKSLHTVRIAAPAAPEYRPEWKENGQLKWVPQEQPVEPEAAAEESVESTVPRGNGLPDAAAQPYEALHQEIAELKQAMQVMAQGQLQPQPSVPMPPDVTQFDFFEPRDVAEYQRQNNAYMQAMMQQSIQAALDPHRDAMQQAEYTRQYNSVLGDYGHDPNFKPLMERALQMVAKSNGKYSIPEAYDLVASVQITSPHQAAQPAQQQGYARPAQRQITAQEAAQKAAQAHSLPPRNGVSGAAEPALPASLMNVGALGRIMLHNQQTGRARPI